MGRTVLVAGGGAAGLMAAITAARAGAKVTVLEQNEKPGKKLLATGNGKCNLTNLSMSESNYRGSDPAFAWKVIRHFDAAAVLDFFHSIGVSTFDRKGWVYPLPEQASAVLELLLLYASAAGVKIKTNEHIEKIVKEQSGKDNCFLVKTGTWQYRADAVIIATGSPASAVRGSSDDAGRFADSFGIRRKPFLPALVPLKTAGSLGTRWSGTRVRASVTLLIDGKAAAKDTGELQLTEYGISGIPVFQVSRFAAEAVREKRHVACELNFMPDCTTAELTEELKKRWTDCPFKTFPELFLGLLPKRLIPVLTADAQGASLAADPESMSESQIENCLAACAYRIRHFRIVVTGPAALSQAQVCQGGICTSELKETMETKKVPGLFFAGEAVDVEGMCGGYNLQWAWSSGYTAGISAAYSN